MWKEKIGKLDRFGVCVFEKERVRDKLGKKRQNSARSIVWTTVSPDDTKMQSEDYPRKVSALIKIF